jgi:prephenate dehydratase
VFTTVQLGNAALGVVPLENSTNGPVSLTYHLLCDYSSLFPDIRIVGEIYQPVNHYLLGRRLPPAKAEEEAGVAAGSVGAGADSGPDPRAPVSSSAAAASQMSLSSPGDTLPAQDGARPPPRRPAVADLSHITRIYSHPQAFGQCTVFQTAHLPHAEVFEVSSTRRAADIVASDANAGGTYAAISSALAARATGLDILAERIEDCADNTTRFLVISKGPRADVRIPPRPQQQQQQQQQQQSPPAAGPGPAAGAAPAPAPAPATKTMITFSVPHGVPGALADTLAVFCAAGLNLTSITSRPSMRAPFQYLFFLEFEGHVDRDRRVAGALEQVAAVVESWRLMGSWDVQQ